MGELTVKIRPPLADYVEDLVAQGRYPSVDDAIIDAVSRLKSENDYAESLEVSEALKLRLRQAVAELEAGDVVDWDPDAIMQEVERQLAQK